MKRTDTSQNPKGARLSHLRAVATPAELAVALVLLCAFAGLAYGVTDKPMLSFDRPVMQAVRHLESSWLTVTMQVITSSASGLGTTVLALALFIYLWRKVEQRPEAVVLALGLIISAALGRILKYIFGRPRPQILPWLTTATGWSFPSGHTLNAVTLAGLLIWLIGRRTSGWQRTALYGIVGLWAVLIGLSRIYLGVHYPSDVLASLAAGTLYLLAGQSIHRYIYRDKNREKTGIMNHVEE